MTAVPEPRVRLAQYIERRIGDLALEYAEVCRRAGISDETLGKIRKGMSARGSTYGKLERALGWGKGSCASILAGGEPVTPDAQESVELAADLYAQNRAELRTEESRRASMSTRELEVLAGMVASAADGFDMSPADLEAAFRRAQEIIQQRRQDRDGRNEGPEKPSRHRAS